MEDGIEVVERTVRRNDPVLEHLRETRNLEQRRATLRVTRQRLLGNDVQRVARSSADRFCQAIVKLCLIRVVGVRGRVVLGQHGDVVRCHTELCEVARQLRVRATSASCQRTESRSRDGGVGTVRERLDVSNHAVDR